MMLEVIANAARQRPRRQYDHRAALQGRPGRDQAAPPCSATIARWEVLRISLEELREAAVGEPVAAGQRHDHRAAGGAGLRRSDRRPSSHVLRSGMTVAQAIAEAVFERAGRRAPVIVRKDAQAAS